MMVNGNMTIFLSSKEKQKIDVYLCPFCSHHHYDSNIYQRFCPYYTSSGGVGFYNSDQNVSLAPLASLITTKYISLTTNENTKLVV